MVFWPSKTEGKTHTHRNEVLRGPKYFIIVCKITLCILLVHGKREERGGGLYFRKQKRATKRGPCGIKRKEKKDKKQCMFWVKGGKIKFLNSLEFESSWSWSTVTGCPDIFFL